MSLTVDKALRKIQSHMKAGELAEAEELYKQVLSKFPKNKKAIQGYQKLKAGIVSKGSLKSEPPQDQIDELISLYNQRHFEAALSKLKLLTSLFPKALVLFNIQGASNAALQRYDAAIDSYKKAIKIKPDHADAYLNIGVALQDKGDLDAAIDSYKKTLKIKPDCADAYLNIGAALKDKGDLDAAIDSYKKAIKIKPDYAVAYYNIGNSLNDKGDLDAAIRSYNKAIKIKPDYADAYSNMGNAQKNKHELVAAIDSYKQVLMIKPDDAVTYINLGLLLKGIKFSRPIDKLPEIIVKILNEKTYARPSDIAPAAVSLIKLDQVFQSVFNRYFYGELGQTLEQSVSELSKVSLLMTLMELCPLPDLEVEWLLTYLRSEILSNFSVLSGSKETFIFQIALALQCYTNEYIYAQTVEDTKNLDCLENVVKEDLLVGKPPDPLALVCLASYKTLHDYSWCDLLTLPDELKQLEKRQVFEFKKETLLRSKITMLTHITNDVSSKVRQQYEVNPYPRWVNLGLPLQAKPTSEIAKSINLKVSNKNIFNYASPQVLIAGCGTGQQSIGTAARFKNCNVLAIDLSLSSIAYAQRKTNELGLKNITYMQADILDLGELGRQFDIVESAGVLHHMDDPMAGWSVLADCLKPSGLLKIGLYSELARQHIVKMREEIILSSLGSDDFSMKSFRSNVISSDQTHHRQITLTPDFYSLSEFRDLLFHVQEHRFTLPQIKNCLNELGLEFCGFEGLEIVNKFKIANTGTDDVYNIDKWETFEQKNPNSFIGMYEFWCQKIQ